jgi:hypothetical protein
VTVVAVASGGRATPKIRLARFPDFLDLDSLAQPKY